MYCIVLYCLPDDALYTVLVFINEALVQYKSIFKVRDVLRQLGILLAQLFAVGRTKGWGGRERELLDLHV